MLVETYYFLHMIILIFAYGMIISCCRFWLGQVTRIFQRTLRMENLVSKNKYGVMSGD